MRTFFETFDRSARAELAAFLSRHPDNAVWMISSDYVVAADDRPNDVFAFTIRPYLDALPDLLHRTRRGLPRDMKDTRRYGPAASAVLRGSDVFHVAVLLPRDRMLLAASGTESIVQGRPHAEEALQRAVRLNLEQSAIDGLRRLREKTRRSGYPHRLLADMLLLALLLPALTIAIRREVRVRGVAWMSDRDRVTEWSDGALWTIAHLNLEAMQDAFGIELGCDLPGVCVPGADGGMWFDELIRLPDHIAGALAAWDLSSDGPAPGTRGDLVYGIVRDVGAEADNVVVIKLRSEQDGYGWSRVVFGIRRD